VAKTCDVDGFGWSFSLLSEQDLATSSHILSGLGGSLVGSSLEADDGLSGGNRFIAELPLVLIGRLGSQPGAGPLGMLVGLSAQSEESAGDLGDVFLIPKVNGLEHINVIAAVVFQGQLEVVDVFHHLELSTAGVDLADRSRGNLVHDLAKDSSVPEDILVQFAGFFIKGDVFVAKPESTFYFQNAV